MTPAETGATSKKSIICQDRHDIVTPHAVPFLPVSSVGGCLEDVTCDAQLLFEVADVIHAPLVKL